MTVTGAPKPWAIKFVEEHEETPRCWYVNPNPNPNPNPTPTPTLTLTLTLPLPLPLTLIRKVRKGVAHGAVTEVDEWHCLPKRGDVSHKGRDHQRRSGFGAPVTVTAQVWPRKASRYWGEVRVRVRGRARGRVRVRVVVAEA